MLPAARGISRVGVGQITVSVTRPAPDGVFPDVSPPGAFTEEEPAPQPVIIQAQAAISSPANRDLS